LFIYIIIYYCSVAEVLNQLNNHQQNTSNHHQQQQHQQQQRALLRNQRTINNGHLTSTTTLDNNNSTSSTPDIISPTSIYQYSTANDTYAAALAAYSSQFDTTQMYQPANNSHISKTNRHSPYSRPSATSQQQSTTNDLAATAALLSYSAPLYYHPYYSAQHYLANTQPTNGTQHNNFNFKD
jgi:hypothetical protein